MSDTSTVVAPAIAATPVPSTAISPAPTKPSLLSRLTSFRLKLHDDWQWIITRSWSIRFMFVAFVLSGAEVAVPLILKTPTNPLLYSVAMGLLTGAAFVARLVAQKHEAPNG